MAEHYRGRPVDAVAAVEARGFLFAAPLALVLRKPLIPLRKPGKLPFHTHSLRYDLEYGSAELHVHTDGLVKGVARLAGGRSAGDRRHDASGLSAGRESRRRGGRLHVPGRTEFPGRRRETQAA